MKLLFKYIPALFIAFDGGSSVPIMAWGKILTEVAQNAPVLAFDPPGIGKSEWDGQRPTLSNMNERLYAVLEAIEAKPPYILVGHSWAGWLVRGFSGRYPDEVAGLETRFGRSWLGTIYRNDNKINGCSTPSI